MKHFLRIAALLALIAFPSFANAANRFAVCTTTCTWDGASTAMWSASTGGATGASVPGAADAVILDAATCVGGTTCTITVNTNPAVQSITMGACTASTTGCILDFSVNNNSPTVTATFSITGAGTRNLKCGTGTFTMSGTAAWDAGTVTALSFTCSSATLAFAPSSSNGTVAFNTGGLTYGTVSFTSAATATALNLNNSGATIGTFNITAPAILIFNSTISITNAVSWNGTSANLIEIINPTSFGSATTITLGAAGTGSWMALRGVTFATSALTATNSFNLGQVTNATITNPSVGGGGGRIIGG